MASIYDAMIGKAADDTLASAEVDKPKQYVWALDFQDGCSPMLFWNREDIGVHPEYAEVYRLRIH